MPFIDLPPQAQERVVCSISAATKYELPVNIMLAVAEKEGGRPGQWVRNTNGTSDVGYMQFNTAYLNGLTRFGITANDVAASGCYPFDLAAWRLRLHLKNDSGDIWTRASNYHSRTYEYNSVYRSDLILKAVKWADWLSARFPTYDAATPQAQITSPTAAPTNLVSRNQTSRSSQPSKAVAMNSSAYVPRRLIPSAQ